MRKSIPHGASKCVKNAPARRYVYPDARPYRPSEAVHGRLGIAWPRRERRHGSRLIRLAAALILSVAAVAA